MTDEQKRQWTRIRAGGAARFIVVRGVLPLTAVGLVSILLFWLATPAARAASMLELWPIAPWFGALGLLISSAGWLSNERLYRASGRSKPSSG